MLKRILIPLDGSKTSLYALKPARELARLASAELLLVRVPGQPDEADVSAVLPVPPEARARERKRCERWLKRLAGQLFEQGYKVTWKVLPDESRSPSRALAAAVDDFDIDLVVIASHGRRGLKRWLRGSVAEELARRSPRPVMLVGPQARRRELSAS